MFINFLYRLREYGVPVGTGEALTLARTLAAGLHDSSLDGYYYAARAVLIHHEAHLDAFDRAFLAEYEGVSDQPPELTLDLQDWLDTVREGLDELGISEDEFIESLDVDELKDLFEQRKSEQDQRHDGGNHWIGTQGTSPFGQAGEGAGLSTGSAGGGRTAIRIADARNYAQYRSDITLDIRQIEMALRRLRAFIREGADVELDMDRTIDETARNAGEIEIVTRPPSRPDTHVILMTDVGGSMYPYSQLMSQLFSATRKATHFKDLRTYTFHNCVYGKVYRSEVFTQAVWLHDLLRECGPHYKLIMVGDAFMAPYELAQRGTIAFGDSTAMSGYECLRMLSDHFTNSVWLNPEPQSRWAAPTIEAIGEVFDMFPMTMEGLGDAMRHLNRGTPSRR